MARARDRRALDRRHRRRSSRRTRTGRSTSSFRIRRRPPRSATPRRSWCRGRRLRRIASMTGRAPPDDGAPRFDGRLCGAARRRELAAQAVAAPTAGARWPRRSKRAASRSCGARGPGETRDPRRDRSPASARGRASPARCRSPRCGTSLAGARLLVCPDTGIAHLGRIVGVPTVTLFGPGSAVICGPGAFFADMPGRAVTVDSVSVPRSDDPVLPRSAVGAALRAPVRRCARPLSARAVHGGDRVAGGDGGDREPGDHDAQRQAERCAARWRESSATREHAASGSCARRA